MDHGSRVGLSSVLYHQVLDWDSLISRPAHKCSHQLPVGGAGAKQVPWTFTVVWMVHDTCRGNGPVLDRSFAGVWGDPLDILTMVTDGKGGLSTPSEHAAGRLVIVEAVRPCRSSGADGMSAQSKLICTW